MKKLTLFQLIIALIAGVLSLTTLDAAARAADVKKLNPSPNIETVRDLPYWESPRADPIKHKLDLYLPVGRRDYPVVLFVHGGGWSHGDKKFWFDLYGRLGRGLAEKGIGVAVTNYRLAPQTKGLDQARDVARAFAWLHRNIRKFGGRADALFVAGHSAGGHLVSLIASDEQYLREVGLDSRAIRGVISISGVYDVRPELFLFERVFGPHSEVRRQASPIAHVKYGLPAFLLLHGDAELPHCDGPCVERFYESLQDAQVDVRINPIAKRDHLSIITRLSEVNDPAQQAILDFIHQHRP
jgi:acetyl esterase/lipase